MSAEGKSVSTIKLSQRKTLVREQMVHQNAGVPIRHKGGGRALPVKGLKDGNWWWILSHGKAESVYRLTEDEFNASWEII